MAALGRRMPWSGLRSLWTQTNTAHPSCIVSMSVLIASATDVLAFLVGVTSVLPALGWFRTWAGVAIVFTGCLCVKCACGHWHDVTCIPCALHMPDGVVALSTAEESWAYYYLLPCSLRSAVSGTGGIPVVYVQNALPEISGARGQLARRWWQLARCHLPSLSSS